jgi:DNA invertase Pin-like site-specific DNA recombinase
MNKYVGYIRVSTKRQGDSGLGLDAQKLQVNQFVKSQSGFLVKIFQEVESGKKGNRPELEKAVEYCKKNGAVLVIAKLDRLYRNVYFTSKLMNEKINFVCCDAPFADNFTIHVLAAVAELEAKRISERTKSALAQAKARGKRLGNPQNFTNEARKRGAEVMRQNAKTEQRKQIEKTIKFIMESGTTTLIGIADKLNFLGFKSPRGSKITSTHVKRFMQ